MSSATGRTAGFSIDWCRDSARAAEAACFFIANIDPSYISHGEIQGGRAVSATHWSPLLADRIHNEVAVMIAGGPDCSEPHCRALALCEHDGTIAGLAMVSFVRSDVPHAVLDDLVVDREMRGRGIGPQLLHWIEEQCVARGMKRLFLESGACNTQAHRFLGREGFALTSHVMMKELE